MNCIRESWHTPDVRALANTLSANWMMGARCHRIVGLVVRRLDSCGNKEIHERSSCYVTLLVVGNFLSHGNRKRLCQTAMDLPLNDHGIYSSPAIVKRKNLANFSSTCIYIYFHYTDVRSKWIGHIWRVVIADCFKARFDSRDRLVVGGKSNFLHCLESLW